MKALILAAGLGTRLRPITDEMPKSMVQVNGKSIITKQIDNLIENGINDIIVVVGYRSEIIIEELRNTYKNIKIIINDVYDKTNNMYSTYLAKDYLEGSEFVLMNADVFFDASVLKELVKDMYINSIVVDKDNYIEENMKVKVNENRINNISKSIDEQNAYGVSIDIYKFSDAASALFYSIVKNHIEVKKDLNQWTEVALDEAIKLIEFTPCKLVGRWMEIDNHDDLQRAEEIFND